MELDSLYRVKNLLTEARHEIQMQRIKIERLEPKAEAYDALIKVIGMVGGGDRAMTRDIMWEFEHAQEDLDGAIKAEAEQQEILAAKRAAAAENVDEEPANLKGTATGSIEDQIAHPENYYPSGVKRTVPKEKPAD